MLFTKRSIVIVMCTIACSITLLSGQIRGKAQTTDDAANRSRYWEIGTDVLWLFRPQGAEREARSFAELLLIGEWTDARNNIGNGIFVRYNIATKENRGIGLRGRLGLNISTLDFSALRNDTLLPDNLSYIWNPVLRTGIEWQFRHRNFDWYYGVETILSYWHRRKDDYTILRPPQFGFAELARQDFRQLELGAVGILGIRYHFLEHFTLSAESMVMLLHRRGRYTLRRKLYPPDNPDTPLPSSLSSEINTYNTDIFFQPLAIINLCYKF